MRGNIIMNFFFKTGQGSTDRYFVKLFSLFSDCEIYLATGLSEVEKIKVTDPTHSRKNFADQMIRG